MSIIRPLNIHMIAARTAIISLVMKLQDIGFSRDNALIRLLWTVWSEQPITIWIDDAGRVSTTPKIPIKVVYTAEL
jgi:hypothetical protein